MVSPLRIAMRAFACAAAASLITACGGGGGGGGGTSATPPTIAAGLSSTWTLGHTVTIPGFTPAGGIASFDDSFIDPAANQYYVADRVNAGIDVVSTTSFAFVSTAANGQMNGVKPLASMLGPNGIVPIGGGLVFTGDGNSTVKVVNVNTGTIVQTVTTANPYTGPASSTACGTPTTGTANARVDEMALDSSDGVVLAVNDSACPAYGTFFSTTAPYNVIGTVTFLTASGGVKQPVWDAAQQKFLVAIPQTTANPGGEVDLVNPKTFTIDKQLATVNCRPTGAALGQSETLFLGCSAVSPPQQIITIDATSGAQRVAIGNIGGCNEVWYNPTANRFYAACATNIGGPIVVVANGNGNYVTSFGTSAGADSLAVDPATENIYVPTQQLGLQIYTH